MMACRTLPTIMVTNLPKRIQPTPINFKEAVFQRNSALLQQKRQEYRQEISNVIEELNKDAQNIPLVEMIKLINENEAERSLNKIIKDVLKDEAIERMFTILKKILQEERVALYKSQQIMQYQRIVKDNITLSSISIFKDKKWFELFTSLENLIKIDQITYFFNSNNQYISRCYLQNAIWNLCEIGQLFDISPDTLGHIKRFYNDFYNIPRISKIGQLVTVFTLTRYKARISKFRNRNIQYIKELYITKHTEIENKSQKQVQTGTQLIEKFRFSELAIFTKERFLFTYPSIHKNAIFENIGRLYHERIQDNRKACIKFIMMQFHVPISIIENFLRNIRDNQQYKNHAYFQQELKKNLLILQKTLKYVFACKALPIQAFQLLNLEKNYNTKLDPYFLVSQCRTDVLACFSKASLTVFKQFILTSALQLSIEAIFQPILAISKFYISYCSLKGFSDEDQEDYTATLVIGTKGKKVLFYQVYREKLSNEKYLIQLKKMIKQQKMKLSQPIALCERQIINPIKWHLLRKFIEEVYKQLRARIYVSILPVYCYLNLYLFSCLLKYMNIFAPLLNKATFYPLCQQFNQKIIRLFKKVQG